MKRTGSLELKKAGEPFATRLYRQRYLYLMLSPAFVLTIIFSYIPIAGWYMAFVNYQPGKSLFKAVWVGLDNFRSFFVESSDFIYIIRNTLVMNSLTIIVNLAFAFVFAILLKEVVFHRFSVLIQAVSFFPFFISWVITYSIIYILFSSSTGAINVALIKAGIIKEGINLLGSPDYAWLLIIAMNLWKYSGYNCVIFLAAISGIPSEQYEAAEIDGADRFQKIWNITVPFMIPTLVVLLIMNSGWILNSNLEQFFLFTNGTNWERMEVFDMYIYKYGLQLTDYSYATAIGIIKSVVSIFILVLVNLVSKKLANRSIF